VEDTFAFSSESSKATELLYSEFIKIRKESRITLFSVVSFSMID
jgi:hypothetical protein